MAKAHDLPGTCLKLTPRITSCMDQHRHRSKHPDMPCLSVPIRALACQICPRSALQTTMDLSNEDLNLSDVFLPTTGRQSFTPIRDQTFPSRYANPPHGRPVLAWRWVKGSPSLSPKELPFSLSVPKGFWAQSRQRPHMRRSRWCLSR